MLQSALVTGATGFIGSRLVRRLVTMGIDTYSLTRSTPAVARENAFLRGSHLLSCDSLSKLSDVLKTVRAEAVFHLAATGVQGCSEATSTIDGNIGLMSRLIEATSSWPLKCFIYTGSCFEYGIPPENRPLTESTSLNPSSVYGAAKASAYFCGRALARNLNRPFTNLRLFGVYGPGEASTRLIPYVIDSLHENRPVSLSGGEQIRDLLFVEDAVDALVEAALTSQLSQYDVYNVCTGIGVSIREVVRTVAATTQKPESLLRWGEREYRPDEPMSLIGSNRRFVEATGWSPKTSIGTGICTMVESRTDQRRVA